MRSFVIASAVLLSAAALPAQTAQTAPMPAVSKSFVLQMAPGTPFSRYAPASGERGCPVRLSARRWGSGATQYATRGEAGSSGGNAKMLFVQPGSRVAAPHGVSVGMQRVNSAAVAGVTMVVHGFGYRPHLALTSGGALPERQQTFHETSFHDGQELHLDTPGVPLVRSVEITEISYADGTSWHARHPGECSAETSGVMLVSSAR